MLTPRGFWMLLIASLVLFVAACLPLIDGLSDSWLNEQLRAYNPELVLPEQMNLRAPVLVALTFLAWFGWQWCMFYIAGIRARQRLRIIRSAGGVPFGDSFLWTRRPISIRLEIHTDGPEIAWLRAVDRPATTGESTGLRVLSGKLDRNHPLAIEFEWKSNEPGKVRFEGLNIVRHDSQRFFTDTFFLRAPMEATILPAIAAELGFTASKKMQNSLPAHGVHRLRQAGSGSELHDLREYQAGDSLRRIAWKISARRDRLMTKELESETPIRSTLFIDVSASTRIGTTSTLGMPIFETPILQFTSLASRLAVELIGLRDPVGLCLVDEERARWHPSGAGKRSLMRIYSALAEAVSEPAPPADCPPAMLIDTAYRFCQEVYPEQLHRSRNRPEPWYLRWPILEPSWFVFLSIEAVLVGIIYGLNENREVARYLGIDWRWLFFGFMIVVTVLWIRATLRRHRRDTSFLHRGVLRARRKQLAAILSVREQSGPGGLALLLEDDKLFAQSVQRFLNAHRVPYQRSLYDDDGRYLFSSREKVDRAARALLRSAAHGRDNELFVLLFDLLDIAEHWQPLVSAIKVARARRHEVVVVVPWPPGLPTPGKNDDWLEDQLGAADPLQRGFQDPLIALRRLDFIRHRDAYRQLRTELLRVGASILLAAAGDALNDVVRRVDRLRAARTAPRR